jgi:hypothetical protein
VSNTDITTCTSGRLMAERPETTSRKTITLPDQLWDQVDEYRHNQRISSEAEAFRRLVRLGLDAAPRSRPPPRKRKA